MKNEKQRKIWFKRKRKRKIKKKNAWLQAIFLGDVGVIRYNSFGDSHFQTYVMDNVDIIFNFYLHITFYVSHTHTNCTHYTQIFAKLYTYDCLSTNLAIFNCI